MVRAIRDLAVSDLKIVGEVENYFRGNCWPKDVKLSGCPDSLVGVMRDALELSPVQRKHVVNKVIEEIKNPPKNLGGFALNKKQK